MNKNVLKKYNFQYKLFDVTVALEKSQGHQKWYEQVKLSKCYMYHHAKFFMYDSMTETVWKKITMLMFWPRTDGWPHPHHHIHSWFFM